MTDILTESFCERCGAKFVFETARRRRTAPLGGVRTFARGLRNYVLSDESLDEALAEARRDRERAAANHQLEAFHNTFNFCIDCRQYTCTDCWNDVAGRCRSCAPMGEQPPVTAYPPQAEQPFAEAFEAAAAILSPSHDVAGTNGRTQYRGVVALGAQPASDVASWPPSDLVDAPAPEHSRATPVRAEAAPWRAEADASGRPEEPQPPTASPRPGGGSVFDPAWSDTTWAAERAEPSPITAAEAERMAAELERLEAEEAERVEAEEVERRLADEAREQAASASLAGHRVSPAAVAPEELDGAAVTAAGLEDVTEGAVTHLEAAPQAPAEAPLEGGPTEPVETQPAAGEPLRAASGPATDAVAAAEETIGVAAIEQPVEGARAPVAAAAETPLTQAATEIAGVEAAGTDAARIAPLPAAQEAHDVSAAAEAAGEVAPTEAEAARVEAAGTEPLPMEPPRAAEVPAAQPAAAEAPAARVVAEVTREAPETIPAVIEPAQAAIAPPVEAAPPAEPAAPASQAPAPPRAPTSSGESLPRGVRTRPGTAPAPEEPAAQPIWQIVAPEDGQAPAPSWPPRTPVYRPPAAPPAPPPSHGFALFRRHADVEEQFRPAVIARPPAQAVWDESSRGVLARPGSGVQACVSCGLPLSASARFCRRCGSRQA
jgi:hypothetical protein